MDQFFANGRLGLGTGLIDIDTAVFKAALVRGYTYNAAHTFVSDVTGAGGTLVATSAALTTPSFTDGVLDFDDVTWNAVGAGAAITAIIIFQASAVTGGADVAASAQRLLCIIDGRQRFTIAAAATGGATALTVDPLTLGIASAAVADRITGAGPTTLTLTSAAAAAARALAVSALGSGVAANDVYEAPYTGANVPITPNGGNITAAWSNGANKILRI